MRVLVRAQGGLCADIYGHERGQLKLMALETAKDGKERGFKRCVAFDDISHTPVYSHDCVGDECSLTFGKEACAKNCGSEITFHTHPVNTYGFSDHDYRQAKLNNKVGGCVAYADPFGLGVVTMKCVRGADVDFQKMSEFHARENEIGMTLPLIRDSEERRKALGEAQEKLRHDIEDAFHVCTVLLK